MAKQPYVDPSANSWISDFNDRANLFNNSRDSLQSKGLFSPYGYTNLKAAPTDMGAFRQNFGGGTASEADYKNWALGQQRERTMGDFVNRMANEDPNASANASRLQGQATDFGNRMTGYLDTAAPTASNTNRFESGLSDAETRLRSLLDNPDSINQSAAYKFRVNQGQEVLQRSLGAKGLLNSGNRLMELTKYGQDMGSQEYDAQAGRLGNLLGNYSQSWLGDKNANTSRYAAESNAWNQRGGLLKDLVGVANTTANQNQQISGDTRNQWANTWVNANNKPQQYVPILNAGTKYGIWKG
jgi:hypothetical protein